MNGAFVCMLVLLWGCTTQSGGWFFTDVGPPDLGTEISDARVMEAQETLAPNSTIDFSSWTRDLGIKDSMLLSFGDATFPLPPPVTPVDEPCSFWVLGTTYNLFDVFCRGDITRGFEFPLSTTDGYLFPDVVKEIAARDSTNLWVITTSNIWAVGLHDGIAVRSSAIRRADWTSAYFDPTLEKLVLVDSSGGVYSWDEDLGMRELSALEFSRSTYVVQGDAVFNDVLGSAAILLRGLEGTRLFFFDPLTGRTEPYPETVGVDARGLAFSAGYLWATTLGTITRINPHTGHADVVYLTVAGTFAATAR